MERRMVWWYFSQQERAHSHWPFPLKQVQCLSAIDEIGREAETRAPESYNDSRTLIRTERPSFGPAFCVRCPCQAFTSVGRRETLANGQSPAYRCNRVSRLSRCEKAECRRDPPARPRTPRRPAGLLNELDVHRCAGYLDDAGASSACEGVTHYCTWRSKSASAAGRSVAEEMQRINIDWHPRVAGNRRRLCRQARRRCRQRTCRWCEQQSDAGQRRRCVRGGPSPSVARSSRRGSIVESMLLRIPRSRSPVDVAERCAVRRFLVRPTPRRPPASTPMPS